MKNTLCNKDFFNRSAVDVAYNLIGARLDYKQHSVSIIETEAYIQNDPANLHKEGTVRSSSMLKQAGNIYVHLIYGLHYCFNIVCNQEGIGEAVLLRAIEVDGHIINGPGRLSKYLGIDTRINSLNLFDQNSFMSIYYDSTFKENHNISCSSRIGISKGKDLPYRFFLS